MSEGPLSTQSMAILQADLGSFEKLEIVHRLWRGKRPMARTALQDEIHVDLAEFRTAVSDLIACGLVEEAPEERGRIRLGARAGVDRPFDDLMRAYDDDRLGVVAILSSIAMQKIRSMAASTFANAFVLRKKRKGDGDG